MPKMLTEGVGLLEQETRPDWAEQNLIVGLARC